MLELLAAAVFSFKNDIRLHVLRWNKLDDDEGGWTKEIYIQS